MTWLRVLTRQGEPSTESVWKRQVHQIVSDGILEDHFRHLAARRHEQRHKTTVKIADQPLNDLYKEQWKLQVNGSISSSQCSNWS